MKKKLALLASTVLVVSGSVLSVVLSTKHDTCKPITIECDWPVSSASGNYVRAEVAGALCVTDAGENQIQVRAKGFDNPDFSNCDVTAVEKPVRAVHFTEFECAWAPRGGDCQWLVTTADGGTEKRQAGAWAMQPGTFTGPDCQPRPCFEVAGNPWTPK